MKIKVLCLNVWEGGKLMENLLDFVRREDPELLALQEVYDGRDRTWGSHYCTLDVFREAFSPLQAACGVKLKATYAKGLFALG